MQVLQIEAVPAYVEHLRREPPEGDALFRELLIGVTQFFRDESAFEALKTTILPSLLAAKQPDDPIRVWVAGCATGEEVYSIAIVLKEAMAELKVEASVTIFGTDIDSNAIAFTRAARYRKMDGVSPERLERWFVREREDYCPVATIREMCVFSQHSVIKDPPFSKLDLVSCRNVLIYMDNEFQHRVMQTFHYGLNAGGGDESERDDAIRQAKPIGHPNRHTVRVGRLITAVVLLVNDCCRRTQDRLLG
jgi:two-component system CheB/CheR fusion protein